MVADTQQIPRREHAQVRAQAFQVVQSLGALVEEFSAPGHPHAVQAYFATLYLETTKSWLRTLPQMPDPALAYRVIPVFFALYQERVVDRLDAPLAQITPHWRRYHRQARRMGADASPLARLWLVALAARAHTHLDLGEAILQVEQQTGPVRPAEWQSMFGSLAARAFIEGARASYAGQRLGASAAALHPFWVPVLQGWRAGGYRRAQAELSPCRAKG